METTTTAATADRRPADTAAPRRRWAVLLATLALLALLAAACDEGLTTDPGDDGDPDASEADPGDGDAAAAPGDDGVGDADVDLGDPAEGQGEETDLGEVFDPAEGDAADVDGLVGGLRGDPDEGTATFEGGPATGAWATVGTDAEMTHDDADENADGWLRMYVEPAGINADYWDAMVADLHERAYDYGEPTDRPTFIGEECEGGVCYAAAQAWGHADAEAANSSLRAVKFDLFHVDGGADLHSVWLYVVDTSSGEVWTFEPETFSEDDDEGGYPLVMEDRERVQWERYWALAEALGDPLADHR